MYSVLPIESILYYICMSVLLEEKKTPFVKLIRNQRIFHFLWQSSVNFGHFRNFFRKPFVRPSDKIGRLEIFEKWSLLELENLFSCLTLHQYRDIEFNTRRDIPYLRALMLSYIVKFKVQQYSLYCHTTPKKFKNSSVTGHFEFVF